MEENLPSKSIQKAITYIVDGLKHQKWNSGDRLPTTRQLAQQIHVNIFMLGKALKILAAKELITLLPSKGIFAGKQIEISPTPQKRQLPAWKRVCGRLEHEIVTGALASHILPELAMLTRRYGVSYQTILKACNALATDGIIIRNKRRFHIVNITHSRPEATLLSISWSPNTHLSLYDDFIKAGLSSLEVICAKNNLSLVKKGSDADNSGKAILEHIQTNTCYGYILWVPSHNDPLTLDLIDALQMRGKPVAIIDEPGDFVLPDHRYKQHLFKIFSPAGATAGKRVARYLLDCGHTRCAFISCYNDQPWSIARLKGVTEVFAQTGVTAYTSMSIGDNDYVHVPQQREFAPEVLKRMQSLFPEALWWLYPKAMPHLIALEGIQHIYSTVLVGNLFKQAISDQSITAWVCANDFIAAAACRFLDATGRPGIRNRISIVGFDNWPVALEHDITSYDFSPAALFEKAVGYIVYPKQEVYKDKTRIEVEGVLIERGSTTRLQG